MKTIFKRLYNIFSDQVRSGERAGRMTVKEIFASIKKAIRSTREALTADVLPTSARIEETAGYLAWAATEAEKAFPARNVKEGFNPSHEKRLLIDQKFAAKCAENGIDVDLIDWPAVIKALAQFGRERVVNNEAIDPAHRLITQHFIDEHDRKN